MAIPTDNADPEYNGNNTLCRRTSIISGLDTGKLSDRVNMDLQEKDSTSKRKREDNSKKKEEVRAPVI